MTCRSFLGQGSTSLSTIGLPFPCGSVASWKRQARSIIGVFSDVISGHQRYQGRIATLLVRLDHSDWRRDNRSMTLVAHAKSRVWGTRNSWSLAPHRSFEGDGCECEVDLEIQGDEKNGYHLVMAPAGFFTADRWYETQDNALAAASELFGVGPENWATKKERG
jgi:hypothetical protein